MSKWTEIRDEVVAEAKAAKIDEKLKQTIAEKIYGEVLPALREIGDSFTDAIKEQSKSESGWTRIRDAFILPICVQAVLWVTETLLGLTIKKTASTQTTAA